MVTTSTGVGVGGNRMTWADRLGTIGWMAKGVIYLLLAAIVAQLAASGETGDESATKEGALARLSDQPFGEVMLIIVALGLAAYAAYRLLTVFLPTTGNDDKDKAKHLLRIGSAVVYGLLAWQAWTVLTRGDQAASSGDSAALPKTWSATLLSSTGGRWLLGVIGVVLIGLAIDQARRGVAHSFMKRIECTDRWPSEQSIERAGTVGHIGRGFVVGLLGLFVLVAAVQADPNEAKGLDEALRSVADATAGSVLLAAVAVGLAAYGLYSFMAARCRDHSEG